MKKSRSNSTKKILIIILALVIGSFIGYRFALAQSGNALKSVVEPGSMTSEASYVIFTDGTNVYAKNGTTGEIEFQSDNASYVLQSTINSLRDGPIRHDLTGAGARNRANGLILIKNDINITSPIDMADLYGLEIAGFGRQYGVVIGIPTNADVVFDLTNSRNVMFRNLDFWVPTGYAPKAVFLLARDTSGDSVGDSSFTDCRFYGDAQYAFIYNFGSETDAFTRCDFSTKRRAVVLTGQNILNITSSYKSLPASASMLQNWFENCLFYRLDNSSGETILLDGGGSHVFSDSYYGGQFYFLKVDFTKSDNVFGVQVKNCNFEGMVLTTDAQTSYKYLFSWDFENNYLSTVNNTPFFDLNKTNVIWEDGRIVGNRFWNFYGPTTYLQFWMVHLGLIDMRGSFQEPNLSIVNLNDAEIIMFSKAKLNVTTYQGRPRVTFVQEAGGTENSGNATVSNNDWVAHGLITTPSVVTITPRSNVTVWVNSRNATHFQVGVSSGTVTIDWHAEV